MVLSIHNTFDNLDFEHKILIILFLFTYVLAMIIQIRDPKTEVKFIDWILAFLASAVGGTIMYFIVMQWLNIGLRMGATITASLVSYRTIKFIVSQESQDKFAKGFFEGIFNGMLRMLNSKGGDSDNKNNKS